MKGSTWRNSVETKTLPPEPVERTLPGLICTVKRSIAGKPGGAQIHKSGLVMRCESGELGTGLLV